MATKDSVNYPLQWFNGTFPTAQRVEELLEPERENGNITTHDYLLAKSFLPGWHRYYPWMYGVPAMITADVLFMRKFPNWGLFRRFWAGTAAGLPLMFVGLAHRSILHYDFSVSLENPLGFARALENVNTRLGGVRPLNVTFAVKRDGRLGILDPRDGHIVFADEARRGPRSPARPPRQDGTESVFSEREGPVEGDSAPTDGPVMDAIKQSSSWEVIRKASSQAQDSSWDKLRQGHERSNIPGRAGASQDVPRELSADEERALEQAKFDAMLEAERNVGK